MSACTFLAAANPAAEHTTAIETDPRTRFANAMVEYRRMA
jgi:hypothetical protein